MILYILHFLSKRSDSGGAGLRDKFTRKWRETVGLCSQSNPDSLSPQSNRREVWSIISKVVLIIFML